MRTLSTFVASLLVATTGLTQVQTGGSGEPTTRPVIAEDISPLELISPVAADGHRGEAFLRKPPGDGPFPAIVLVHGGLTKWPIDQLKEYASRAHPSRFLEAGYVVAVTTYRSRDIDPQTTVSLEDILAAVDYLKNLDYVDPNSVAVRGTSGGGSLTLDVAAATDVVAIVVEEPASVSFTGIRTAELDGRTIRTDPRRYYTPEHQTLTREKISRMNSPILMIQGDQNRIPYFNAEILIPELNAAGKDLTVITYAGEPHSFAFHSTPERTPRPAVALKAFRDMDAFLRMHLPTQPKPMDADLVDHVPW